MTPIPTLLFFKIQFINEISTKSTNSKKADSHNSTMVPIFVVSTLLGLFSVDYTGKTVHLLWSKMFLTLANGLIVAILVMPPLSDSSIISAVLFGVKYILMTTCISWHLIIVASKKDDLKKLLVHLNRRDVRFNYFELTAGFLFLSGQFALNLVQGSAYEWRDWTIALGLNYYYYCIFLIIGQFGSFAELLAKNVEAAEESVGEVEPVVVKVEKCIILARTLGAVYNVQLLTSMVLVFFNIVSYSFASFNLLQKAHSSLQSASLEPMARIACHVSAWFSLLWYVCGKCTRVTLSVEKFNAELFKLMRENVALCNNEKLHLYLTMKPTVQFTACGFFNLGYSLVTSIIAAAITYLVILIQL